MSANDEQKDQMEWRHFDAFRRLLSDFPAGVVQKGKPPEPDFLVDTPSGKLGVELTGIVIGAQRAMERFRSKVFNAGADEYKRNGGPDVRVTFHWRNLLFPKGVTSSTLGSHLARLVKDHVPEAEDGEVILRKGELLDVELVGSLLSYVRISRGPGVRSCWLSGDGGPKTSQLEIAQERVAEKEERLPGYRNSCSEVWLLLVADGGSVSQMVNTEALSKEVLEASFDRIYLLDFLYERLYPIQLRCPPPVPAKS